MTGLDFKKLDIFQKIVVLAALAVSLVLLAPYFGINLLGSAPSPLPYPARDQSGQSGLSIRTPGARPVSAPRGRTADEIQGGEPARAGEGEKKKLSEIEEMLK